MDDRRKSITIRCYDHCRYDLVYPAFFMDAPKATLRKIFKWLFMFDWYRENEETIAFFDQELPYLERDIEAQGKERIAEKEKTLRDRVADYEKVKLDPDPATFPANWTKEQKRAEVKLRKEHNARYGDRVKEARADLNRAKKQAPKDRERAKQVFELYQTAKTESR